ncbi:DNA-directed RNA polymerase subunit D [Candidatus Woesearchaeota archaeon]|jgi:DNA-directed RNA polymerase subunit D|nr:DNA-directed RNA polymerase subunit D [Candidatus Woesearchaeota archaeon]MBT7237777.1 DNA-directed RNA polymerase subunit D [Candidatus Woesearchaeota archaeon]
MEVKIINKTDEKLVLEFTNASGSEMNTFRRMIVSGVPVMAIEEVEFIKNDSALFDEVVANRLGLIPLTTDLNTYNEKESCKCSGKGCPLCQVEFSLEAKGPCTVYASEIISKDEKVKPVFDEMPIVKLLEDQELKFNAISILGKGKEHMKYAPGVAFYHHKPKFIINNDAAKINQFRDQYPEAAIKDGKFDEETLLNEKLYDACEGVCDELFKVEYEEDKFIFYLESFGQMTANEVFVAALEKFNDKLNEFEKAMKGGKEKQITDMAKKLIKK